MEENKGALFVISGPSGVGKGTIIQGALKKIAQKGNIPAALAVSVTTRPPRPGEVDGIHYHFISRADFRNLLKKNALLEHTKYAGNYYGTPATQVEMLCRQGFYVLLDIETAGAMEVKRNRPDAVLCFVQPPSREELERRLRARGTETEESIARRLEIAENEQAKAYLYDYRIVNDTLCDAIDRLVSVLEQWKKQEEPEREN